MSRMLLLVLVAAVAASLRWTSPVLLPTDKLLTKWHSWTRADGLAGDTVWAVLPVAGGVWAGTASGLSFFDGKSFRNYGTKEGLVHQAVTSLALDPSDGSLWIGTLGGVSHLGQKGFKNYTQSSSGLVNDVVYAVALQGDIVWMATTNGLSAMDRRTGAFQTFDERNAPFHENWCYGASVQGDKLYLAVWGGGLCIRDVGTGIWENFMDPDGDNRVDLLPGDGILSDVIVTASVSGERVWVASYFGVGAYDGRRWQTFSTRNSGLPRNFVNTVKAEGNGCWIGTDTGLAWFDGRSRWITYRQPDGGGNATALLFDGNIPAGSIRLDGALGSDFVWAVAEAPDGRVWVGTARGLSLGTVSGAAR